MVTDVGPTGARLTYRQLARRARQTHESLPPSTVATMLHRSALPSRDLVAGFQTEGLRRSSLTVDGRPVDECHLGLLLDP